jgi:hypothetical protein
VLGERAKNEGVPLGFEGEKKPKYKADGAKSICCEKYVWKWTIAWQQFMPTSVRIAQLGLAKTTILRVMAGASEGFVAVV